MTRLWFAMVAVGSLALASCEAPVEEPTTGTVGKLDEAVKACPFFVPFCPDDCHLDHACPPKCHCPQGKRVPCGTITCNPNETCCCGPVCGPDGPYSCSLTGNCPISRKHFKTD